MAQEFETFRIERRDAAAVVWMNRPEKLNAMGPTFFRELPVVLDSLGRESELRAIVLTGAGDAFSAGGDIASFGDLHDIEAYRRHLRLVFDAFHSVERAELPVIAAVEPTVGLMPGYGIVRGPDVIGRHWTRWLALTADIIDARQALEIGLVQQVVPHDRLLDEALAVAGRIAANAPLAVRLAKQFVNRDTGGRGLAETVEATALLFTTEDHKEGIAAFLDKRPPGFRGR